MKKSYILILSLIFASSVFSQTYKPMLKEGKTWEVKHHPGFHQSSLPDIDYTLFFLEGDSLIDSTQYFKLHSYNVTLNISHQGPITYPSTSNFTGILLREDTILKKIWARDPFPLSMQFSFPGSQHDSLEVLIYDFSLSVGDTLWSANWNNAWFVTTPNGNVYWKNQNRAIIDSIGQTTLGNNEIVRVFYLTPIDPFGSLGPITIIEGVGGTNGFRYPFNHEFENSIDLLCVNDNGTALFGWCNSVILNLNDQKVNSTSFKIYPNPTSDRIISIEGKELESVKIHDITGKLIIKATPKTDKTTIDLNNQPQGIYFIRAEFKNGDITTKKLIVN